MPEDQQLTRLEALRHATTKCAWNLAQEDRLGSLVEGNHADLIDLSDDCFTVEDEDIKDIPSVLTIVDGRVVFLSWRPLRPVGSCGTRHPIRATTAPATTRRQRLDSRQVRGEDSHPPAESSTATETIRSVSARPFGWCRSG